MIFALAKAAEENPNLVKIFLYEEPVKMSDHKGFLGKSFSELDKASGDLIFYSLLKHSSNRDRYAPQYVEAVDRIIAACHKNRQRVRLAFLMGSHPLKKDLKPGEVQTPINQFFNDGALFEKNVVRMIFEHLRKPDKPLLLSKNAAAAGGKVKAEEDDMDAPSRSSSASASASSSGVCKALPPG